jgi:hypothetical protein
LAALDRHHVVRRVADPHDHDGLFGRIAAFVEIVARAAVPRQNRHSDPIVRARIRGDLDVNLIARGGPAGEQDRRPWLRNRFENDRSHGLSQTGWHLDAAF